MKSQVASFKWKRMIYADVSYHYNNKKKLETEIKTIYYKY